MRFGWLAVAWLPLFLVGCLSPRTATQTIVYIDAQPLVRAETARLVVNIRTGPRGDLAPLADPYEFTDLTDELPIFPRDFTFVPFDMDASRIFEVEAIAYDRAGDVVTIARLRGGFVANAARTLRLVLEDACRGITCPGASTCRGGMCIQLRDPSLDAGPDDSDAGVPPDAPPQRCTTDAECDDGVFCNGPEECKDEVCQPGPLPDCDDHIDCTDDVCTGAACNHTPNPSRCRAPGGVNPVCDLINGCQYDNCDESTCVPTGCTDAVCAGNTCMRTYLCTGAESDCCGMACVRPGCADDTTCTNDRCGTNARGEEVCLHEPVAGACDDGDACTMGDSCAGDRCVPGSRRTCDDSNPCTDDSCDSVSGCINTPNDTVRYDDGDECTIGDACRGGVATPGMLRNCDDGVACTADSCAAGGCVNTPQDSLCVAAAGGRCDPVAGCQYGACVPATCTPTDACETANCVGGTCQRTPVCTGGALCCGGTCCPDDSDPCRVPVCVSSTCGVMLTTAPCDDGNACTTEDRCSAGSCSGRPVMCPPSTPPCRTWACVAGACVPTDTTASCDLDSSLCTPDVCGGGICRPGTAIMCPPDANPCTFQQCNRTTGMCETGNVPDGMGFCIPGGPIDPCTNGVCDGSGGCVGEGCRAGEICCNGSYCAPFSDCSGGCMPPGTC